MIGGKTYWESGLITSDGDMTIATVSEKGMKGNFIWKTRGTWDGAVLAIQAKMTANDVLSTIDDLELEEDDPSYGSFTIDIPHTASLNISNCGAGTALYFYLVDCDPKS